MVIPGKLLINLQCVITDATKYDCVVPSHFLINSRKDSHLLICLTQLQFRLAETFGVLEESSGLQLASHKISSVKSIFDQIFRF
jgi:hypothetical protein